MRLVPFAMLALLAGCSTGDETISATSYRGIDGQWLTSASCEAFVSGVPYPRVVAFRMKGQSSPFRLSTADEFYGIRTWCMDPIWSDNSFLPSKQRARVEMLAPNRARIVAAPEKTSGLQLIMEVRLDESRPVMTVRHGFRNLRSERRDISIWVLAALDHEGMAVTPWRSGKEAIKKAVFYPESDPSEPCLKLAKTGMGVDYRIPSKVGNYKVGTDTNAGWVAYFWGSQAVVSRVRYSDLGEYPDGGAPITFYNCGTTREWGFCEFEHVGPLQALPPNGTAWLEQTLRLISTAGVGGVDENIARVRKALGTKH